MWLWLDNLKNLPPIQHHVMINHYALFIDDLDEPNADITDPESYTTWYFGIGKPYRNRIFEAYQAANVNIVFSGHIHCRRPVQVVEGFNSINHLQQRLVNGLIVRRTATQSWGFFIATYTAGYRSGICSP